MTSQYNTNLKGQRVFDNSCCYVDPLCFLLPSYARFSHLSKTKKSKEVEKPKETKPLELWKPNISYIMGLVRQKLELTPKNYIYDLISTAIDLQIYWVKKVFGDTDSYGNIHREHFEHWVHLYIDILTQATTALYTNPNDTGPITTFIREFTQQFGTRAQLEYDTELRLVNTSKKYDESNFNRLKYADTLTQQINFSHMIESEYFTVDGVKYIRRKTTNNTYLKSKFDGNLYIEAVDRVLDNREYEETDIEIEDAEVEAEEKTEETEETI